MAARRIEVVIVGDASSLQRSLAKSSSGLSAWGEKMQAAGKKVSAVGHSMTTHLTLPILAVGAVSVKMAADFSQQMEQIRTQAGASQGEVNKMTKAVLAFAESGKSEQGPQQLAEALYHIESLGLRGSKALDVLKMSSEGAAVSQSSLEDVANALGGAVRTGIKGTQNYTKAMGTMNAIIGAGNMKMKDLTGAFSTGILPSAKLAGLSLKDVGAALATMTDENVPATAAATRLRMSFSLLAAPSAKADSVLKGIGLTGSKLGHEMQSKAGLIGTLGLLRTHLMAIHDPAKRFQVMSQAFGGGRSAGAIMTLVNNLDVLKGKYKQIGGTTGNFAKDWQAQQKQNEHVFKTSLAQIEAALIHIGSILLPIVAQVAVAVAGWADAFSHLNPTIQKVIVYVALVVAAVGPFLVVLGSLITAVGTIVGALPEMGGALAALTGPVGLIVAAIALLVGGLVLLYLKNREFHAYVVGAWHEISSAVVKAIKPLVKVVMQAWNEILATWRTHAAKIEANLTQFGHTISQVWHAVWTRLKPVVAAAWGAIKGVVVPAIHLIRDIIVTVMDLLAGDWSGAWHHVVGILKDIWQIIVGVVKGAGSILKAAVIAAVKLAIAGLETILSWVGMEAGKIGMAILNGIVNGVSGLADALKNKVTGAASGALGAVKGVLGIGSPSKVFAKQVGMPMAQGIMVGFTSFAIGDKLASSIGKALEVAKKALRAKGADYRKVWATFAASAMGGFDTETRRRMGIFQGQLGKVQRADQAKTPAERALAKMQGQDAAAARQQALKDAQAAYQDAVQYGDPAQVRAAKEAVLAAQAAIERVKQDADAHAKEAAIKRQEAHYAKLRALQRRHLEKIISELAKVLGHHKGKDIAEIMHELAVDLERADSSGPRGAGSTHHTGHHSHGTGTGKGKPKPGSGGADKGGHGPGVIVHQHFPRAPNNPKQLELAAAFAMRRVVAT